MALCGELVEMQAQKILSLANGHLPDDQKFSVQFFDGLMQSLMNRNSHCFQIIHGGANTAATDLISEEMSCIL